MSAADIDLDRLADLLRSTAELSPLDVALELGDIGPEVLPTVPNDKPPLLTSQHIKGTDRQGVRIGEPCRACLNAGLSPAADHGATTDPDTIRRYWSAHPDAGVGMKAHPRIVRGDADHADARSYKDSRKRIGYGQPGGCEEPFTARTPGGQYRRRYMHWLPEGVPAPGGGTEILGVSWYGLSGFVVIKGGHPSGKDYAPFTDGGLTITELPETVALVLQRRGTRSGDGGSGQPAANSEAVETFLAAHMGTQHLDRLARRRALVATASEGDRHHQASGQLVAGFREAVAGWYPARTLADAIRQALGEAGWTTDRLDGDEWAGLLAWSVGKVQHLDRHTAAAEITAERYEHDAAKYDEGYPAEYVEAMLAESVPDIEPAELDRVHARESNDGPARGTDATPETDEPDIWEPVDLTPAWNGERKEPEAVVLRRSDGLHLLPAGVNYLYGGSGDGKSLVAMLATYQLIRDGHHVVWITYEDTNELEVVKRLKALGTTDKERQRLDLIIAKEALSAGIGNLARRVRSTGAHLVVLDSTGEANAEEGVNEDSDHEWGQWARATLRYLIDLAGDPEWENAQGTPVNDWVAELPIDHSTKAHDGSFFPSGTKRKRAMVTGRMFMVNVRQAFGIGQIGRVQLVAAKDRTGVFRRGEIAAEIVLDATATPYTFTVDAPASGSEMSSGKRRAATDRVLAVLLDTDKALTASDVHRIVNTDIHRLPGENEMALGTVKNTLTKLDKRPGVRKVIEENGTAGGVRHLYKATEPGEKDDAA